MLPWTPQSVCEAPDILPSKFLAVLVVEQMYVNQQSGFPVSAIFLIMSEDSVPHMGLDIPTSGQSASVAEPQNRIVRGYHSVSASSRRIGMTAASTG
ncbi:MAG: hypothetical protein O2960_00560 [Verrucomicrobia bacterium]|nr:hypothetical protein [Verrucomicrobiota bacterium]